MISWILLLILLRFSSFLREIVGGTKQVILIVTEDIVRVQRILTDFTDFCVLLDGSGQINAYKQVMCESNGGAIVLDVSDLDSSSYLAKNLSGFMKFCADKMGEQSSDGYYGSLILCTTGYVPEDIKKNVFRIVLPTLTAEDEARIRFFMTCHTPKVEMLKTEMGRLKELICDDFSSLANMLLLSAELLRPTFADCEDAEGEWKKLLEEAKNITFEADDFVNCKIDAEQLWDLLVSELSNQYGSGELKAYCLPDVPQRVIDHLDDSLFANGNQMFVSRARLEKCLGRFKGQVDIASAKQLLYEAGLLERDSEGKYRSWMPYRVAGKADRKRMCALDIRKASIMFSINIKNIIKFKEEVQ